MYVASMGPIASLRSLRTFPYIRRKGSPVGALKNIIQSNTGTSQSHTGSSRTNQPQSTPKVCPEVWHLEQHTLNLKGSYDWLESANKEATKQAAQARDLVVVLAVVPCTPT